MRPAPPLLLMSALTLFGAAPRVAESPGPPTSVPALKRIAVIGASLSDGFLLPLEVDAMVTFADVVRATVKHHTTPPFRRSSALFFQDPTAYGTRYADAARKHDPSLVIAVDFLFWFAYGFSIDDDDRLDWLETGLSLLETFECPILVSDFPDMRRAATEGVGVHGVPMIHPLQVPSPEGLRRLNARVAEWVDQRENAHLVRISRLLERIHRGQEVEVRGNHWPENSQATLINEDLLHTTFEGTIALSLIAMDVLARENADVSEDAFVWDKEVIRKRVLKPREAERRQRGVRDP